MEIEYYEYDWSKQRRVVTEDVCFWIKSNLREGGIEEQIARMRDMLSVMGEKFLAENPDSVSRIAEVIRCDGENHSIKQHTS